MQVLELETVHVQNRQNPKQLMYYASTLGHLVLRTCNVRMASLTYCIWLASFIQINYISFNEPFHAKPPPQELQTSNAHGSMQRLVRILTSLSTHQ